MRLSRCMSLLPRTTLHSDSEQLGTALVIGGGAGGPEVGSELISGGDGANGVCGGEAIGVRGLYGDRVSGGGSLGNGGDDGDRGWVAEGRGADDTASLSVSNSASFWFAW
jgi:hypothetical protein